MVAYLRTTLDAAEIVYDTGDTARLRPTALFLEVIYLANAVINESPSSSLSFLQTAAKASGTVYNRTVSQSLTLDSGVFRAEWPGTLLQLFQAVSLDLVSNVTATNAISFAQTAIGNVNGVRPTSSTLALNVSATWKKALPTKTASSSFTFSQSVNATRLVQNILAFVQSASATVTILGGSTSGSLTFSQTVSFDTGIKRTLTTPLLFNQTATRTVNRAASTTSNNLSLGHEALHSFARKLVTIQAPWGAITKTIVLPSPEFQDAENLVDDLTIDFAEDGTLYTYIRTQINRRLNYTFQLTRQKGLEFQDFIDEFNSASWKLTNWKGEVWKVKLVTNPVEFVIARRGAPCGPTTEVSITLEGEKLQ